MYPKIVTESNWMNLSAFLKLLINKNINRGLNNSARFYIHYIQQFVEHSTPRKITNMFWIKVLKWLRITKVSGMPFIYTIDPLNVCNLRCQLCPTGLGTLGRVRGKITNALFQKIISQIAPYAYKVNLFNWGEPFLHPDIFEMIEFASSRKIEVLISSNLNHFNQEMAEKTVRSGLDTLLVSVDGTSQEVYEKYRRKGNISKVLDNLHLLVDAKQRFKSKKPFIYMRMLVNRFNEHQVEEMKDLAKKIGVDAFEVGPLFIDTDNVEQVKEWLPENQKMSAYNSSSIERPNYSWHCLDDLWENMVINWDGGVAPCCWIHNQQNDFANATNESIRDIWNSSAYISSRRVFASNSTKEDTTATICTRCRGYPHYLKD